MMTEEFISRAEALEDFEECNKSDPKWTPQRVKTLLLRQPAADVVPVAHGKWIKNEWLSTDFSPVYDCSECHKSIEQKYLTLPQRCEHCGALMDGRCR
jgi:hypothetical protein